MLQVFIFRITDLIIFVYFSYMQNDWLQKNYHGLKILQRNYYLKYIKNGYKKEKSWVNPYVDGIGQLQVPRMGILITYLGS